MEQRPQTLEFRQNEMAKKDIPDYTFVAAAAKSLQSCPTLCDHLDGSPPGSTIPGILQARTLEWVTKIQRRLGKIYKLKTEPNSTWRRQDKQVLLR